MEKQTPVSVKRQNQVIFFILTPRCQFIWIISYYRLWIYFKAGEVTNFLNDDPESSNYKLFQYPVGCYPTRKLCDLPVKVYKAKYDYSRFTGYQMKVP